MMRVKAVAHVLGLGGYNFVPGDIFDLPDDKANDIIARGWAVPYASVTNKPIEAAVTQPTQHALSRRGSRGRFVRPEAAPPSEEPQRDDEQS